MKKKTIWLIFVFVLALLAFGTAAAQDPTGFPSDDDVNAIAKQLYCPVCENTPLDVCPTQACAQWRALIREKLIEGKSEAEIKQYFVDFYGDRVLASPPARGLNWLVYIIPPAAIGAGAFILFSALRSWKRPIPPQAFDNSEVDITQDDYVKQLEEELRKR